jgi:hypothetical protein
MSASDTITANEFKSINAMDNIQSSFNGLNELSKEKLRKQVNGVFSFSIKNNQGETCVYVLDLDATSTVLFNQNAKPNVFFYMLDGDFVNLAQGKLNGKYKRKKGFEHFFSSNHFECGRVSRPKSFYVWKAKDKRRHETCNKVGYDIQAIKWKMQTLILNDNKKKSSLRQSA